MKILSYRYLPLNAYFAYFLFVVFVLLIAPVRYRDLNFGYLIGYLCIMMGLFVLGYYYGSRKYQYLANDKLNEGKLKSYIKINLLLLLTYGSISYLLKWYFLFRSGSSLSLFSIGENYLNNYEGYVRGSASVNLSYVFGIFDQALILITLLFCICNFKKINKKYFIILIFLIFSYVFINVIGDGKQKYLGDIVVFGVYASFIYLAVNKLKLSIFHIIIFILTICAVSFLFIEIIRQRYAAAGIGLYNISEKAHPLVFWDESSFIFDLLGPEYGFALGILSFYFTNGLYGLYLSLISSFEWSYFVGNSYSVGRIIEILLGEKGLILSKTYPYRVGEEFGWGFDKWHSLFAWMASDITFIGVLLLTPFFACFYGRLWVESVSAINPFSGPLFIFLSLGLVFSFANNQIMHGPSGVIVLIVLLLGWLFESPFNRIVD